MSILPIGDKEHFYGYIIGLRVAGIWNVFDELADRQLLLADFEYNSERTTWIVPDYALFVLLLPHLQANAYADIDEGGMQSKLYISKKDGQWVVEVP